MPVRRQQYRYAGMPTMSWGCAASFRKIFGRDIVLIRSVFRGSAAHLRASFLCPEKCPELPRKCPEILGLTETNWAF